MGGVKPDNMKRYAVILRMLGASLGGMTHRSGIHELPTSHNAHVIMLDFDEMCRLPRALSITSPQGIRRYGLMSAA